MRRIWWTWDIRARWAWGFSADAESFVANYRAAVDAAERYGVEGIVIWGFLRDSHGGVDAARRVADYAHQRGVMILPGVGVDTYGGVYYSGDSPWSLDCWLADHPEAVARKQDGSPFTFRWPTTDTTDRMVGCPSHEPLMDFYRTSLDWLFDTFGLRGMQIEQGDVGLCWCDRCRARTRTPCPKKCQVTDRVCLEDMATRLPPLVEHVLNRDPDATVLVENYCGLLPAQTDVIAPFLAGFPERAYHSWQAYDAPGVFDIDIDSQSPAPHGCLAIRTNNDIFGGELDDRVNITRALELAGGAGLDMTYIYGEYPDSWPVTRDNYETWSTVASAVDRPAARTS